MNVVGAMFVQNAPQVGVHQIGPMVGRSHCWFPPVMVNDEQREMAVWLPHLLNDDASGLWWRYGLLPVNDDVAVIYSGPQPIPDETMKKVIVRLVGSALSDPYPQAVAKHMRQHASTPRSLGTLAEAES